MTRDQMMELMQHPKIAKPKLDSSGVDETVNNGQLTDKDNKVIDKNMRVDERGRFVMTPKHV